MSEVRLKDSLTLVYKDGITVYGGRQQWSSSPSLSKCGCGVIAAAELIMYLCRSRRDCCCPLFDKYPSIDRLSADVYDDITRCLSRTFLPVIPPFGMNGLVLAIGVNRFFRKYSFPYKAGWGVRPGRLWQTIEDMLAEDIPVIFSVGPNLPKFWKRETATFYAVQRDGGYSPAASTTAHYVIVTGIDDELLEISSWGNRYYIKKSEYEEYVQKNSNYLVSNMLYVYKK